jgi:hypothetical protein
MHWKSDKEIEVDISMGDVVHFERFKWQELILFLFCISPYIYIYNGTTLPALFGVICNIFPPTPLHRLKGRKRHNSFAKNQPLPKIKNGAS